MRRVCDIQMQSSGDQIWDPEHDWILQFERILKPGGLGSAISSVGAPKNDTAEFRQGMITRQTKFGF